MITMKTWLYSALFLFMLFVTSHVMAEPLDCNNAITQTDMNSCSAKDFEIAQLELEFVYKKAHAEFQKKDEIELFEEAHAAWVAYRDAHCTFSANQYDGGTIKPLIHATCMENLTKERTWHIVNLFPE